MRRPFLLFPLLFLITATSVSATYIVVLRDGTRYRARSRWVVKDGKALVTLETGSVLQLDPALIDPAKSDELNRSGLGDVKVLATPGSNTQQPAPPVAAPSLSAISRARRAASPATPSSATAAQRSAAAPAPGASGGTASTDFSLKLQKAYENVGLFDARVTAPAASTIRVELTADSEDQVFKTLSATAFVMSKAQTAGAEVGTVELFMKTIRGGSSGRFRMNRPDADEIANKRLTWQSYYVKNVIF